MATKDKIPVERLLPPDFDLPGPGGDSHQQFSPRGRKKTFARMVSAFLLRVIWKYALKPVAILAVVGWGTAWLFPSVLTGIGAWIVAYIHGVDVNGLVEWASEAWKNLLASQT